MSHPFIVLGDFNHHLESQNDADTVRLLDNLEAFNLKQIITKPTHQAGHTLDGIFTSDANIVFSHTSMLPWTDHTAIVFNVNILQPHIYRRSTSGKVLTRRWNKISSCDFGSALNRLEPKLDSNNETAALQLNNWLQAAADAVAPKTWLTLRPGKISSPWYS